MDRTLPTSFVHLAAPQSDVYADIELLKAENEARKKENEARKKENDNMKKDIAKRDKEYAAMKEERDKVKKENEKVKATIELYMKAVYNKCPQGVLADDVQIKWMEKENQHLIFFKIADFFRLQRDRIIKETADRQEILIQLNRLEQCRRNAMAIRGQKIKKAAVIGGAASGVTAAVVVGYQAIGAKAGGVGALAAIKALPGGTLVGSFLVAGVVVGLVSYGGMLLYTHWCDRAERDKKNE